MPFTWRLATCSQNCVANLVLIQLFFHSLTSSWLPDAPLAESVLVISQQFQQMQGGIIMDIGGERCAVMPVLKLVLGDSPMCNALCSVKRHGNLRWLAARFASLFWQQGVFVVVSVQAPLDSFYDVRVTFAYVQGPDTGTFSIRKNLTNKTLHSAVNSLRRNQVLVWLLSLVDCDIRND